MRKGIGLHRVKLVDSLFTVEIMHELIELINDS